MCDLWILSVLLLLNKRPHMSHSAFVEAGGVGNGRCTGASGFEERSLLLVSNLRQVASSSISN